jgi:hypothetical protein
VTRPRLTSLRPLLAFAALLTFAAAGSLAQPECAYACSCVPPRAIADYRGDKDYAILVGRVADVDANQRGRFEVERWYQGGSADVVAVQGGGGADCGLPLSAGQRLVLVAFVDPAEQVIHAGICSPSGDLSTPEGQKLGQEVVNVFGAGQPIEGGNAGGDIPFLGLAVAGGLLVLLVGGVMVVAGRERA